MRSYAGIKGTIRGAFRSLGFEVHRIRVGHNSGGLAYEYVSPHATYSPWNSDRPFLETYKVVESHTLVDRYRCYELWTLVEQSMKLDGALLEIGLWRGGSGALIAQKAKLCGITDTVYLCDTFSGIVKAGGNDSFFVGGEYSDTTREIVDSLIFKSLNLDNVRILEGVFPDETSLLIKEREFRFCHIDVDVYQSAKEVTEWLWDKLVIGGIVVYDDYGFYGCDGVTKYVEQQKIHHDRLVIHNLNGHALVIKIK